MEPSPATPNPPRTPRSVWDELLAGNARFVDNTPTRPNQDLARRLQISGGQTPSAVVLACSDSRVPVEILFDQGLGDLFVVRTAGQTLDTAVMASVEYAVDVVGVDLIVVLGHESCGAVAAAFAALDDAIIPGGFSRMLVEKVMPSILRSRKDGRGSVQDCEQRHIHETVAQVLARSELISSKIKDGSLGIVGGYYQLSNSVVLPVVEVGLTG